MTLIYTNVSPPAPNVSLRWALDTASNLLENGWFSGSSSRSLCDVRRDFQEVWVFFLFSSTRRLKHYIFPVPTLHLYATFLPCIPLPYLSASSNRPLPYHSPSFSYTSFNRFFALNSGSYLLLP